MKEKLQEYALIAEIISALAVIITLIVLIMEIRENTEVTKSSAYQYQLDRFNEWRTEMSGDDSKLTVFNNWNLGKMPEANTIEWLKLEMILNSLWSNYESGYTSLNSGIIEGNEWERIERSMCAAYPSISTISSQIMKENVFARLSAEFTDFVELTCKENQ